MYGLSPVLIHVHGPDTTSSPLDGMVFDDSVDGSLRVQASGVVICNDDKLLTARNTLCVTSVSVLGPFLSPTNTLRNGVSIEVVSGSGRVFNASLRALCKVQHVSFSNRFSH